MRNCKRVRRVLALFVSGDADEAATRALRLHLAECPACRQAAGELTQAQTALERLSQEREPVRFDSLWPEIRPRLARLQPRVSALLGWVPVAAMAAACLAVYLLGSATWGGPFARPGIENQTRVGVVEYEAGAGVKDAGRANMPVPSRAAGVAQPVLPLGRPVLESSRPF